MHDDGPTASSLQGSPQAHAGSLGSTPAGWLSTWESRTQTNKTSGWLRTRPQAVFAPCLTHAKGRPVGHLQSAELSTCSASSAQPGHWGVGPEIIVDIADQPPSALRAAVCTATFFSPSSHLPSIFALVPASSSVHFPFSEQR